VEVARPVRRAGRRNPLGESRAGRSGPTPTPSTPPERASATARWSWTASPGGVVGWSIDAEPTAALVTNALGMAIQTRTPPAGAIIHSDQGVQFASWAFTQRAKDSRLVPSMGSVGDRYDNAMIEAF
jgi:transposase InsO family protein